MTDKTTDRLASFKRNFNYQNTPPYETLKPFDAINISTSDGQTDGQDCINLGCECLKNRQNQNQTIHKHALSKQNIATKNIYIKRGEQNKHTQNKKDSKTQIINIM